MKLYNKLLCRDLADFRPHYIHSALHEIVVHWDYYTDPYWTKLEC